MAVDDSCATGERAVVTAAHPIAADIGAGVLRDGATVYDAAVAAALAETVLLPPKCGLAGDVVALAFRAGVPEPEALISVGPASRRLGAAVRERGLPATGGLSVGIPGAPGGYAALATRGRFALRRLAAPAIELARMGFPWPGISAYLTAQSVEILRAQNPGGVCYLPGGTPAPDGAKTTLPGLADLLECFVDSPTGLYEGAVGDAVHDAVRRRGGVIERDELSAAGASWVAAARVEPPEGTVLWTTPAPTHGPSLLDAVRSLPVGAGPAAVMAHVEHAVARRTLEAGGVAAGGGTSVVTAGDRAGNAVVVVHSNSFQRYGSGIVVEPYGLVLSNRPGRGFTATPGHTNFPAPGRRPVTTLHAWAAGLPDGSVLTGATPGGENQMRWNGQTIAAVRDGQHDPAELVRAPRWARHGGRLTVEAGFSERDLAALGGSADVTVVPHHSLRSSQQAVHLRTSYGPDVTWTRARASRGPPRQQSATATVALIAYRYYRSSINTGGVLMVGRLSWWERGLLGTVRLFVALSGLGIVVFAPLKLFGTVYGAVTGNAGARSIGFTFPVHVATELPPAVVTPSDMQPGAVVAGTPTTQAWILAGALPSSVVIGCAVAWVVPVLLTLAALVRGYRLSHALTDRSRFDHAVAAQMRVLALWVVGASVTWSVVGTAGSVLAVTVLEDPRLHAALDLGPALVGTGLAALLVLFTVALRMATALQDDQDLTV